MNCDIFIALMSGHIDGANTSAEEEELQAHLNICEDCRSLLSVMKENDALMQANMAQPPADLTAKIMQKVRNNPKRNSKKTFYTSLAATGLAAAAMLGIFISADNARPPQNEGVAVASETENSFAVYGAKRTVNTEVGVLVLHGSSEELSFEGEMMDTLNLPISVERAGYSITGDEKEAYTVAWEELKRIHEVYGGSLYNPEAGTSGILIFVD